MKIYTKTGDSGETMLFGGQRVPKYHLRLDAYGAVDELNAFLGLARRYCPDPELNAALERVQNELFALGSDLATPKDVESNHIRRVEGELTARLEREIDLWTEELPPLKTFILPGGGQAGAILHIARTVCRRAERAAAALNRDEPINPHILRYLNRLSDWLFTLARLLNHRQGVQETPWRQL
ncbi:MAG: cob(I)yrinic acid a,c-diamide adenosyltransferase [Chloroflexi bacterium]|nr:cob(I)yrinic acid a,c-diamide adenosyltransferase [Chloroflexota bacterium]